MQQRSDVAREALRIVASGRPVPPDRLRALYRAGLIAARGCARKAKWRPTEEGEHVLAGAEA